MAKDLSQRPSELAGFRHPVTSFYFDRAIYNVGSQIESEIEKAQSRKKSEKGAQMAAQMVLNRWLRSEGAARYRDPASG